MKRYAYNVSATLTTALQPPPEQLAITHKTPHKTNENAQHDRNQTVDESQTEKK